MSKVEGRELTFSILKYNPLNPIEEAKFVDFKLEETKGMTLFIALNIIRQTMDANLAFDFVCRAGICGSCGMVVNGKPRLACRTLTKDYADGKIQLMPMPAFELIRDLSVNTGKWMDAMSMRVESWIHEKEVHNITKIEEKIDPNVADKIFELDRCIECGLCVSSCATALMRPDFVGAVGLNRIVRFQVDPHDKRSNEDFYELVGDDNGIFGCMSLMACEDHCPKKLPLQEKIAYLRRKMVTIK